MKDAQRRLQSGSLLFCCVKYFLSNLPNIHVVLLLPGVLRILRNSNDMTLGGLSYFGFSFGRLHLPTPYEQYKNNQEGKFRWIIRNYILRGDVGVVQD